MWFCLGENVISRTVVFLNTDFVKQVLKVHCSPSFKGKSQALRTAKMEMWLEHLS